jgi:hypothetical protein
MDRFVQWDRLLASPLFAPLHPLISALKTKEFPTLAELNALLDTRAIALQSGRELRFVEQGRGKLAFEDQYEPRCYFRGEVQTRQNNWHDLFNALVWLTCPRAKAVINARHYQVLIAGAATSGAMSMHRGAVRDTNTLLDESGVIVVYSDEELAGLLRNFRWRELFWQRRERVRACMGFYLFGHGLYEKALNPYEGMTGQGLLFAVPQEFFVWPMAQQMAHLDGLLARFLEQHCLTTRELSPVPLLGVPGWTALSECESYYDNTAYFRPGRRGAMNLPSGGD